MGDGVPLEDRARGRRPEDGGVEEEAGCWAGPSFGQQPKLNEDKEEPTIEGPALVDRG